MKKLLDLTRKVYVLSNKLNTKLLEKTLSKAGFSCTRLNQTRKKEYRIYSKSYLAFLNHHNAWKKIANDDEYAIVVEEDFVPVVGFGALPIPFNTNSQNIGFVWLYSCGPRLYSIDMEGHLCGGATSMVAYILSKKTAKIMLKFADKIMKDYGPNQYSPWDSFIDAYFISKGLKNHITIRDYGEHGGIFNPEHKINLQCIKNWHHAEILADRLAFLPYYARNSKMNYVWHRLLGRGYGLLRLFSGRYLRPKIIRGSSAPIRLIKYSIRRQLRL